MSGGGETFCVCVCVGGGGGGGGLTELHVSTVDHIHTVYLVSAPDPGSYQ